MNYKNFQYDEKYKRMLFMKSNRKSNTSGGTIPASLETKNFANGGSDRIFY